MIGVRKDIDLVGREVRIKVIGEIMDVKEIDLVDLKEEYVKVRNMNGIEYWINVKDVEILGGEVKGILNGTIQDVNVVKIEDIEEVYVKVKTLAGDEVWTLLRDVEF